MAQLYLTQQGSRLQKDHGRFVLTVPDRDTVDIPMQEVEQVLVFGNVQITTPTIAACLTRQIPVMFLSQTGTYRGHLWQAEYDNYRAKVAQLKRFNDSTWQFEIARSIVKGKAWNSKQLLLKLNRRRDISEIATAVLRIERDLSEIDNLMPAPEALDQLRGYEGAISAHYFSVLGQLIAHPQFTFTVRRRRPATDPVNALLSFGYMLLFNNKPYRN